MDTTFRTKARLLASIVLFVGPCIVAGVCFIAPILGKSPSNPAIPSAAEEASLSIVGVKIGTTELYFDAGKSTAYTNQFKKDILFALSAKNAAGYDKIEGSVEGKKLAFTIEPDPNNPKDYSINGGVFAEAKIYKIQFAMTGDGKKTIKLDAALDINANPLPLPKISPEKISGKNREKMAFTLTFAKTLLNERIKDKTGLIQNSANEKDVSVTGALSVVKPNKVTVPLNDPNKSGDFLLVLSKESIQDVYGNQFKDESTSIKFKRDDIGVELEKPVIEKIILPSANGAGLKEIAVPAPSNLKLSQLGTYTVVVKKGGSQIKNSLDLDVNDARLFKAQEIIDNPSSYQIQVKISASQKYKIAARAIRFGTNDEEFLLSDPVNFEVKNGSLIATSIKPVAFGGPRGPSIALQFSFPSEVLLDKIAKPDLITLEPRDGQAQQKCTNLVRVSDSTCQATFPDPTPGRYYLRIAPGTDNSYFSDQYGNTNDSEVLLPFERNSSTDVPVAGGSGSSGNSAKPDSNVDPRGLRDRDAGPYVPYHEYTTPRAVPQGFNPDDRVETRVSRLYYYRDAHRVVQILNRKARSYNRAAVDVQRQVAEKARTDADGKTDRRRSLERIAVQAAVEARAIETQIANLNAQYQNAFNDREARMVKLQSIQGNLTRKADDLKAERLDLQSRAGQLENQVKLDTDEATRRGLEKAEFERRLTSDRDASLARAPDDATKEAITKDFNNKKAASDEHYARVEAAASIGSQNRKTALNNTNNRINSIGAELDGVAQASPATGPPGNLSELDALTQSLEQDQAKRVAEIGNLTKRLEELRLKEVQANEAAINADAEEARAREEQFRREVAAAMEDPDTFAPGAPYSYDPVEQVSISVIGEGLIQLRGPMKGINNIRLAINQIDAPVGQTRISVHTIQINGERGDRMEKVSQRIQTYLDQSRFLTSQAGQMLRKAVVKVASEKSMMPIQFQGVPPGSQMERDYRYLVAFFGTDFIRELQTLDSEFLRTGNKLLSLHSMDSTSLANSLFLIALAKNDVRHEILMEFERLIQCELPVTEQSYITQIAHHCDKLLGHKAQYQILSSNARFESLKGFLNAQVADPDGLNPMQREFIRLAQIFKSQLVTELELKQRVIERSIIEVRLKSGKTIEQVELEQAAEEEKAQKSFDITFKKVLHSKDTLLTGALIFAATAEGNRSQRVAILNAINERSLNNIKKYSSTEIGKKYKLEKLSDAGFQNSEKGISLWSTHSDPLVQQLLSDIKDDERHKKAVDNAINDLAILFGAESLDIFAVMKKYTEFRRIIASFGEEELLKIYDGGITTQVKELVSELTQLESRSLNLANKRRSLDHKKMLDMFVSDMEDKYVEILEGTRAHTANIDNHLKAIITALDDDFNRQFYQPAFSQIRHASRFYDVTFGQVDTTNVLANNRGFAKVDPQATMEFDLPRRDILIQEALKSGKALVQDYGALLQDPTFLTLGKLGSGSPTSSMAAGTGSALSPVRNVLPGLPGTSSEGILAQQGPGNRELGSALEALIPDPAIYKFETGTGYEIRPVIQPDGQAVVFKFNYMYTTNVREPVRADEKHLGRVKRHFINTDVQLSNYELREVSTYRVALKAARTAKGVPLLEDVPGVGVLFRPLASDESALQQNQVYAQATIFPTLFDLMGLRWAPAIADMDALRLQNSDFIVRNRARDLQNRIYDYSTFQVDNFLRIPEGDRRTDLYRSQESIPWQHPNGYSGPGLNYRDSSMREGYNPRDMRPDSRFAPAANPEGNERAPRLPIPNRDSGQMIPGAPGVSGVSEVPGMSGRSGGAGYLPGGPNPVGNLNLGSERSSGVLGRPIPSIINSPGIETHSQPGLGNPGFPSRQPNALPGSAPYMPASTPMSPKPGESGGEPNKVSSRGREYDAPGVLPAGFTQGGTQPNSGAPARPPEKGSTWGFRGIWGKSSKPAEKPSEKTNQNQVIPVSYQQSQPPASGESPQVAANAGRSTKTKPSAFAGLFAPAKNPRD